MLAVLGMFHRFALHIGQIGHRIPCGSSWPAGEIGTAECRDGGSGKRYRIGTIPRQQNNPKAESAAAIYRSITIIAWCFCRRSAQLGLPQRFCCNMCGTGIQMPGLKFRRVCPVITAASARMSRFSPQEI
jgi:hypothetical protein